MIDAKDRTIAGDARKKIAVGNLNALTMRVVLQPSGDLDLQIYSPYKPVEELNALGIRTQNQSPPWGVIIGEGISTVKGFETIQKLVAEGVNVPAAGYFKTPEQKRWTTDRSVGERASSGASVPTAGL